MERLMTKEEVAACLRIAVKTLDRWISRKRIPFIRLSRKAVRFEPKEIEAFKARYRVEPVGDPPKPRPLKHKSPRRS
jgi:excisionase family DNA binding protein